MKSKLTLIALFIISIITIDAKAQTVEVGTKQTLSVTSAIFFPFSTNGNNALKAEFPNNSQVTVTISNNTAGAFTIAAGKDFAEIGEKQTVMGSGTFTLDYSSAGPSFNGNFGISIVPTQGISVFDIEVAAPPISTSSTSSSSSSTTGGPVTGDLFSPDSFTILGRFLDDTLVAQISNENNNKECSSEPTGVSLSALSNTSTFDSILNSVFSGNSAQRTISPTTSDLDSSAINITGKKNSAMGVYNIKLSNPTDMTKIYLTAIFPSTTEEQSVMVGRITEPDLEVTIKEQSNAALAAVQHAIISASMPWQLSNNGGFFITEGGGCTGPYCAITEQGMVTIVPGGSCTPSIIQKRKAGYPTLNPSKLFDPFIAASGVIQIPTSSIVNSKHPLVSKVAKESNYIILQPVPPGAKFTQQLKFNLNKK